MEDYKTNYGPTENVTLSPVKFLHVGGYSFNLANICCQWSSDGSVSVTDVSQKCVKLTGLERDLVAEAVCLPSPAELAALRAGVTERRAKAATDEATARKAKEDAEKAEQAKTVEK